MNDEMFMRPVKAQETLVVSVNRRYNKDTKIKYDDCINRNISRNIIRNNLVFASYICIRNALICLIMLLILMTIPIASV